MATRKTKKKVDEAPLAFEDSMERLSLIVEELEDGELTLESSLGRFEEGIRLVRSSQARLDQAEARVEELLGVDGTGEPITRELNEE